MNLTTDTCVHCGEDIEVNVDSGYGVHLTGDGAGSNRCAGETGTLAHTAAVSCSGPCLGTHHVD